MYNRDHGPAHMKSLSRYARALYKRARSKVRRKIDKQEISKG